LDQEKMKRKSYVGRLSIPLVISCLVLSSATFSIEAANAATKRNESRWFLQNVCMANATKLLGRSDWEEYDSEANAARKRLKKRGVPEAHLKEMEDFTVKTIRSTTTAQNVHKGPQLCIQWYKT
jgi:tellurite resistance protein